MKKLLLWCGLIVMALPGPAHRLGAQSDDFPRTVIDATGAPVTIPARPAIIATTTRDPLLARLLSPERIRYVTPATEDWQGIGLLVTTEGEAAAYPALVETADAASVPVYRTALIRSLSGWREAAHQLGRATGSDDQAARLVARLDQRLAAVRDKWRGCPPTGVVILTPEGYTFGPDTLITDLIEAAGGTNLAAGYDDFRQIDDPSLRALAPEVILLSPAWTTPDLFTINPAYADLPAVRSGRVYRLPFSPTAPPDPAAVVLGLAFLLQPVAMVQ